VDSTVTQNENQHELTEDFAQEVRCSFERM